MTNARPPDFFLVGAPKAGTSALHAALSQHPRLFLSPVKEPKYYMCGDSPPPAYRGPGDAHSNQEWVWQRERYLALFDGAPPGTLRGDSTPFYLYNRDARRRIHADNPDARLVAVLRDPVDRAYSNWMHLWVDGLEPVGDVVAACALEDRRLQAGWAPFWHYHRLGMYGRQVADLLTMFPREQLLLLRYRELIEAPGPTLNRVCAFLGVEQGLLTRVPTDNSRLFVRHGPRSRAVGSLIRTGARVGALLPPRVWREASRPLLAELRRGGTPHRPALTVSQREQLLAPHLNDIDLLEEVSGLSFEDWRDVRREGSTYRTRAAADLAR